MLNKSKLGNDEIVILILFTAIIFGTWFRIMPAWMAGFPVNDGGMFYRMILDLQANHYAAPLFTTYNHSSIPFAYPPLGFYIGAGISNLFNVSPLAIVRWLPGILNALCIPFFYLLAKELLNNKFQGSIATLVYAMSPRLTSWLSMGGGLTRSLGAFFLILTILFAYKLLAKNDARAILGTILFGSMTVLSHTESTVFAIGIPIYIWLAKSRSLKNALQGGLVALGVFLLAGPWYWLIINRHGPATLLSALQTGGQVVWSVIRLINIDIITEEPYLDLLGVFGVLGMTMLVAKKQYFIPGMLVVIYLFQPRSAATIGNIPFAIAAAVFIAEILLPTAAKIDETRPDRGVKVFMAILSSYILVNSIYQGYLLSQSHVSKGEQTAMQWIKENTSKDSQFLVLTGEPEAMCDSSAEWFPALTERESLSTLQGREWILGNKFGEFMGHQSSIQACIDEELDCMKRESVYFGEEYDYVYISIKSPTNNCKPVDTSRRTTRGLVNALKDNGEYTIPYESEDVVIFEKVK